MTVIITIIRRYQEIKNSMRKMLKKEVLKGHLVYSVPRTDRPERPLYAYKRPVR